MRTLLKVLTVASCCLPITAHAGEKRAAQLVPSKIEFTYVGFDSFYSCDYVQRETEGILKVLGARDLKVRCLGGLPYDRYNSVTATFKTVQETTADTSTLTGEITEVKIGVRESCDLHKFIFENSVKKFQVYAKVVHESCWNSQGNFAAKLQVLK